jgi:DNA polymerase III delta prime subunit
MNYKLILENIFIKQDNHNQPNLLLYGNHNIDKYKILNEYLLKIDKIPLTQVIQNDILYFSNNTFKLFDISKIKKRDLDNFFNILFEIIKCKNYYNNKNRILIINNFNHISNSIQDKFRVIFEKYRLNTIFILISDNFNSISNPIKSRFLCLRIGDFTREEKISISYPLIKNLDYEKRIKIYDKIYQLSDKKDILNYTKNNYGLINNYHDIIKEIYLSIKNMKELNLIKLKEYAYLLEKYHIKYFHRDLFNILASDIISIINIKNILLMINECEIKYNHCFNRILSNEYLLLLIFNETRKIR